MRTSHSELIYILLQLRPQLLFSPSPSPTNIKCSSSPFPTIESILLVLLLLRICIPLECVWTTGVHNIKANWFSFSQPLSTANIIQLLIGFHTHISHTMLAISLSWACVGLVQVDATAEYICATSQLCLEKNLFPFPWSDPLLNTVQEWSCM